MTVRRGRSQRPLTGRIPFALALTLALQMSGVAFGRDVPGGKPASAGGVAQALIDAINAHDLDAVLRTYAPDSVARRLPGGEEFLRGHPDIRAKFAALFEKNPGIHIEIIGRIVHGDHVIDREKISGLMGGAGPSYGAVVYEIRDGLIRNEWYLPKTSTAE